MCNKVTKSNINDWILQILLAVLVAVSATGAVILPVNYGYGLLSYYYPHPLTVVPATADISKMEEKTTETDVKKIELKTIALTYLHHPLAYSVPLAYASPATVTAPVAYTTGVKVEAKAEPIELHGYEVRF